MVQKSWWRSSPGWGHLYHNWCSPDWTILSDLFHDDRASFRNSWTQKTRWTKIKSQKMRTFGGKNWSHKKNPVLDSFGLISGSFKLPRPPNKKTSHEFLPFQSSSFYKYRSSFECVIRKLRNADSPHVQTKCRITTYQQKDVFFPSQNKRHEPWNAGKGFSQRVSCFLVAKKKLPKRLGSSRSSTCFRWTDRAMVNSRWFASQASV